MSSDLTGEVEESEEYATKSLTAVSVALTITDLPGDGEVGMGDSLLLLPSPGFSATTTYTLTLMWEPTGGMVCTTMFSG